MRRINTGDVIALAVDGVGRPPVGIVIDADDDAFTLGLYQWITGTFGGGTMLVRRRDVRATLWAEPLTEAQLAARTFTEPDDAVLFDMDPLGQFQRDWQVT